MRARIGRLVGAAALVMTGAAAAVGIAAQQTSPALVTAQDILDGFKNTSRWLTYAGDYTGRRHSPLAQISRDNVHRLTSQWTFQTDTPGRFEAAPIVVDGIIYITTGVTNNAWAIDARTGRQIWRYRRELPARINACCGAPNRGFAVLGDQLFMATLDAHVVSLDMKTGSVIWDVVMADSEKGYAATLAPLVVKDKVIVGVAGGEYGIRGFVEAYDARTGTRVWRFYTVPAPGEPGSETWPASDAFERGGGAVWQTGTYDPEQNLIFYGTGNPSPDYYGDDRIGDNLYTNSLLAIDPDTGKLRWHYQFTPHDQHDWDAVHVPVLADLTIGGRLRKTVIVANRNGFFYTLDRVTGKVIVGKPFINTTWAKELDGDGRPIMMPGYQQPNETGVVTCPSIGGGTNFFPPSFDPTTGLFYVTTRESCSTYYAWRQEHKPGDQFWAGASTRADDFGPSYGALRAIDPTTGQRKWEFRHEGAASQAGILSTAGGLVFSGDADGNFMAFDALSGKNLWRYQMGAAVHGVSPVTYMLDGRQYMLIPVNTTLTAFALPIEP